MNKVHKLAKIFLLKLAQNPEAQELLKKHLGPKEEFEHPVFEELLKRDIVPIIAGKKWNPITKKYEFFDTKLGKGVFSRAFEVSYKGKHAVAKITKSRRDYEAMIKLNNLKESFGTDAKHIANVIDYFEIEDDMEGTFYVIIVEKLLPLNEKFESALYSWLRSPDDKDYMPALRYQYDYLDVIENINKGLEYYSKHLNPKIKILLLEKLNFAFKKAFDTATTMQNFRDILNRDVDKILHTVNELIKANQANYDLQERRRVEDVCKEMIYSINRFMPLGANFPEYHVSNMTSNLQYFLEKPETKDFLKFLFRLANEFNIRWDDLHGGNIMVRPKTNDLVISDPGLFSFG